MKKKNETQVSENRYILPGDSEDQPPTLRESDAETNAPVGGRKPASNQGNTPLFAAVLISLGNLVVAGWC